jgi:hypothetical protein
MIVMASALAFAFITIASDSASALAANTSKELDSATLIFPVKHSALTFGHDLQDLSIDASCIELALILGLCPALLCCRLGLGLDELYQQELQR